MTKKKNKQHDSVGIDDEVKDLFGAEEEEEKDPFSLPAIRKSALLPKDTESKELADDDKVDKDAEYARSNLYELIEHGMAAVQDLSHLAREQMHPRTYEVLSNLISNLSKNNNQLLELSKTKKEAKRKENPAPDGQDGKTPNIGNVEKAVFIGSSHDLLKMLNNDPKESEEPKDAEEDERF